MFAPEASPLFTPYRDPGGQTFYILTRRAAPQQQAFYFVNDSCSPDGRYLWLYASFPPAGGMEQHSLAVADLLENEVRVFHDAQFWAASPLLERGTDCALYTWENAIYRRSPRAGEPAEELLRVPARGLCQAISTHLTCSPDGRELFLDRRMGNRRFDFGSVNLETGVYTPWREADFYFKHGQFNPVDGDLALVAKDFWVDLETGERQPIPTVDGVYERLWVCTRGGRMTRYAPLGGYATHEWWGAGGECFYYCSPEGIARQAVSGGAPERVHACRPWHAFSSRDESRFVYDQVCPAPGETFYRGVASSVRLFDARTGEDRVICTLNPSLCSPERPNNYHIDPHPRFIMNDRYVVFTTTVLGRVDLAVAPV